MARSCFRASPPLTRWPPSCARRSRGSACRSSSAPDRGSCCAVASNATLAGACAIPATLVYVERDPTFNRFALAWSDREGRILPLPLPPGEYRLPRISPHGKRIAVGIGQGGGGASDIWIHTLGTGRLDRLTFDNGSGVSVWTPDGRHVVYATVVDGQQAFAQKAVDDGSEPRVAHRFTENRSRGPVDFAPDGSLLYSDDHGAGTANDVMVLAPGSDVPIPLAQTAAVELAGAFSPDGRFVAYSVNSSGEAAIFVQRYPGPGGRWQIAQAADGGLRWSPNGDEIFYTGESSQILALAVRTEGGFSVGAPRKILEANFRTAEDVYIGFDVGPDGRILLVLPTSERDDADHLVVVLDWLDELERRLHQL